MLIMMDQITNLCNYIKYTEKMFYNRYIYKIVLKPAPPDYSDLDSIRIDYFNRIRIIERARKRKNNLSFSKQIKTLLGDTDHKSRVDEHIVTFYLSNESDIQKIANDFKDNIIEIHCPINENHKNIISNNRKIRVRERLFDNNFKFKVNFKINWQMREERFPEIREWIDTLDNEGQRWAPNSVLKRFIRTNREHRYLGWTIAVYLNDEADLFLCRLKFHNMIESVEEAVLVKDL